MQRRAHAARLYFRNVLLDCKIKLNNKKNQINNDIKHHFSAFKTKNAIKHGIFVTLLTIKCAIFFSRSTFLYTTSIKI